MGWRQRKGQTYDCISLKHVHNRCPKITVSQLLLKMIVDDYTNSCFFIQYDMASVIEEQVQKQLKTGSDLERSRKKTSRLPFMKKGWAWS